MFLEKPLVKFNLLVTYRQTLFQSFVYPLVADPKPQASLQLSTQFHPGSQAGLATLPEPQLHDE